MLKFYNNFNHKFIYDKKIISICSNNTPKIVSKNFLSIHYKSDIQKIDTNVLVGFVDKNYSSQYLNYINNKFNYNAHLHEIELDEFKYIGSLMNLPIVVVMNDNYNDTNNDYDIFYYFKNKKDVMRRFNKKNL
jgi:hypothetical protein